MEFSSDFSKTAGKAGEAIKAHSKKIGDSASFKTVAEVRYAGC